VYHDHVADLADELTLYLERPLEAPNSVVFAMFVEPRVFSRWWGPAGFTARAVEIDARVGGAYRIEMQPPESAAFVLSGEYLVVDPPERLAYTFVYDVPDPDDRDTVVSISLFEFGSSTRLVVDHRGFATEARRSLHEQGWTETLDRLELLLQTGSA
jgi:uncharacterized protein YndB with AHSA1/START domain